MWSERTDAVQKCGQSDASKAKSSEVAKEQLLNHVGAHRSLARGSVRVCHAILREVLTESRQRPLGAFGHPSSQRTPESNHELGLRQTDINKNIECIFSRRACCSRSSVKNLNCNRCRASFSANFEKSINYILLKTPYMQLIYKNKARNCFFFVAQ